MLKLSHQLVKRQQMGNLRTLYAPASQQIDFASNDYLGLARSSSLRLEVLKEWDSLTTSCLNGLGSTGSRLLTGQSSYAEALENHIAGHQGFEAGLLFSCGYMANVGLLSAIVGPEDLVLFDSHVHASMQDGIRLSRARGLPFRHQDLDHLESRLGSASTKGQRFICVESIYSVDGSMASLKEISDLSLHYGASLIVDEAHAIGVTGPQGKGLVLENQINHRVFAQIITFGKALGTYGAMVLGSQELKNYLINFARSCIYTTSLPLHNLIAIQCAYQRLLQMEEARSVLQARIQDFKTCFEESTETPIQTLYMKGNHEVQKLARYLTEKSFDVRALMSPTVRRGYERLRICLHAFNTKENIERLAECTQYYRENHE